MTLSWRSFLERRIWQSGWVLSMGRSRKPRDRQLEVGRGLIQIKLADRQGDRWNGGFAVADYSRLGRLLECQGGELGGWPILP